jgi:hypothetical protein
MDNDDTDNFLLGFTILVTGNKAPTILGEEKKIEDNVIRYDFIQRKKIK